MPPQSAEDVQCTTVLPAVGHVVPSTQVAWIWFMTTSTQQVCVRGVHVDAPHATPPPPPASPPPSEPSVEASGLPPPEAPLLDVLPPSAPPLDVPPEPLPLEPEAPLADAPLLDIVMPDELPPLEPPDPPLELVVPPPSPPPPAIVPLDPLHATKPTKAPAKTTTGDLNIVYSSRPAVSSSA
jgi:hypothetical protein